MKRTVIAAAEAQQKASAARSLEQLRVAWMGADTKLRVEDL
jgi:hypothetical protein